MQVVVVESPAKAKTINKYLGKDYHVLASYGHIRDLPSKDGSVDPDADFAMKWDTDSKSAKRINEIAEAVKKADRLILATDPDREGEAISWHVLEALNKKRGVMKDVEVEQTPSWLMLLLSGIVKRDEDGGPTLNFGSSRYIALTATLAKLFSRCVMYFLGLHFL